MARSSKKSQKQIRGKQIANGKKAASGKTKQIAKSAAPPKAIKAAPKAKAAVKGKTSTTKAAPKPTKTAARPQKAVKVASVKPVNRAPPAKVVKAAKTPAPKRAAKEPKVASGPKGYTAAEYVKFKEFKEKFEDMSNQALKDLLRANYQSMSGNKDELVYKCADGATLGRIPRCPKCFGGRPKFDFQKGTYYCSGYRDDVDFKNCHSTFQLSELTRDAWTN